MNPFLIPDHTLLRPIGRGAYGEVWLARNVMGTLRAVKVIQRAQFESDRPYEREFAGIQRYEPVSRSSGGLVHVLHVGRNDAEGYFYYVMELADAVGAVSGLKSEVSSSEAGSATQPETQNLNLETYVPHTLRSELKRLGRLPTAACLRLALDVVSGLAQLHRQQLVHRDVKPGNIIYVNGRAKLADIGLVAARGEGRTFVGTEGYIPPEGPGTPSADLYALGVVLYEASTGYAPERFPDVPVEWFADPASDDALEFHEVILKACEGQRERRYQSADELQADLALLQSGQSVRHVRALERRYARLRLTGIVATTLLVCAIVAALLANYRAQVAAESRAKEAALREQAQNSQARAQSAERQERQQLYFALLEQARATVRSSEIGQRVRTLDAVRRAAAISNTAELRREAFAALALPDLRFKREMPTGPEFTMVQLDPTFERMAMGRGVGPVEIRRVADQTVLATLPPSTNLTTYVGLWSFDGRFLAVKRGSHHDSPSADWEIWDVSDSQCRLTLRGVPFGLLSFHPRRARILTSRGGNQLIVWDVEREKETAQFEIAGEPLHARFSPDGQQFAVLRKHQENWTISVHDSATGKVRTSGAFAYQVKSFDWHADSRWIAVPDNLGDVHLQDVETGQTRILGRHKSRAVDTFFTPDGDFLFSGGLENELICWDLRSMQRAFTVALQSSRVQFRADGNECAVVTATEVQCHAFERYSQGREINAEALTRLSHAAFSSDGRWLVVTGRRQIGLWDWARSESPVLLPGPQFPAVPFFTPDRSELFAYSIPGISRWRLRPAPNNDPPIEAEAVPVNTSRRLVSALVCSNNLVLIGNGGVELMPLTNSAAGLGKLMPGPAGFSCASPDHRWLALRCEGEPWIWINSAPEIMWLRTIEASADVMDFAFTARADELAVAVRTGLEFYNTANWERTRLLPMRMDGNSRLLFAPDGRTVWVSRDAQTAALYEVHSLEMILPLPRGTVPLALTPDGKHLAVSVDLRRLQVWDLKNLRARFRELGLDWGDE